jgi:hypothetical protein
VQLAPQHARVQLAQRGVACRIGEIGFILLPRTSLPPTRIR